MNKKLSTKLRKVYSDKVIGDELAIELNELINDGRLTEAEVKDVLKDFYVELVIDLVPKKQVKVSSEQKVKPEIQEIFDFWKTKGIDAKNDIADLRICSDTDNTYFAVRAIIDESKSGIVTPLIDSIDEFKSATTGKEIDVLDIKVINIKTDTDKFMELSKEEFVW